MKTNLFTEKEKSSQVNNDIKDLSNCINNDKNSTKDTYKKDTGINHIPLHENEYKAQQSQERDQDIKLRGRIQNAVFKGLKFQDELRVKLARFYIWFISIVTIVIFYVIIDPVALYRHVTSYYSNSIKLMLVGAFFANILSILMIMYKFSFAPIKDMTDQFKGIGGKHWNDE